MMVLNRLIGGLLIVGYKVKVNGFLVADRGKVKSKKGGTEGRFFNADKGEKQA